MPVKPQTSVNPTNMPVPYYPYINIEKIATSRPKQKLK